MSVPFASPARKSAQAAPIGEKLHGRCPFGRETAHPRPRDTARFAGARSGGITGTKAGPGSTHDPAFNNQHRSPSPSELSGSLWAGPFCARGRRVGTGFHDIQGRERDGRHRSGGRAFPAIHERDGACSRRS